MALNECSYKRAEEWRRPTRTGHYGKRAGEIRELRRMYGYSSRLIPRILSFRKPQPADSTALLFNELATQWRNETAHLSAIPKIVMHPAYQRIVGMGRPALPLILRAMQNGPGYWFWALENIARETPVAPEDAGHIKNMRAAWIQWGEQRGLL